MVVQSKKESCCLCRGSSEEEHRLDKAGVEISKFSFGTSFWGILANGMASILFRMFTANYY